MSIGEFLVERSNINNTLSNNSCMAANQPLSAGEVRMRLERFAFTANNVTYAAFGDIMKYWQFFPAEEGYGSVPVWGFAEIIESTTDALSVGDRYYGYFPMSSHLILSPTKISPAGFFDGKDHRADLSPIYNYYIRTSGDPSYMPELEEVQMLFRPLFTTSLLIDDFLADNNFFGAKQVILSSASSKTAFGLAFQLSKRVDIKAVGLTSARNKAFVESLGFYDEVITYDDIETLNKDTASVYVDMAGNGDVRQRIHAHFEDILKYSCSVGASHWDQMGDNASLKGPRPTLFFAPGQAQKRTAELGAEGLQDMIAKAWKDFISAGKDLLDIVEETGLNAIERVYRETADGTVAPSKGYILRF